MANDLVRNTRSDISFDEMADMITEPGDYMLVKATKRGRSTKVSRNGNTVTRLEMKNCNRFYITRRK